MRSHLSLSNPFFTMILVVVVSCILARTAASTLINITVSSTSLQLGDSVVVSVNNLPDDGVYVVWPFVNNFQVLTQWDRSLWGSDLSRSRRLIPILSHQWHKIKCKLSTRFYSLLVGSVCHVPRPVCSSSRVQLILFLWDAELLHDPPSPECWRERDQCRDLYWGERVGCTIPCWPAIHYGWCCGILKRAHCECNLHSWILSFRLIF